MRAEEFALAPVCCGLRSLAHLARCACAILRRETADTTRVVRVAFRDDTEPFNDSTTEIA
jgi:hypothetical protein